jgi:hypothetical protein
MMPSANTAVIYYEGDWWMWIQVTRTTVCMAPQRSYGTVSALAGTGSLVVSLDTLSDFAKHSVFVGYVT